MYAIVGSGFGLYGYLPAVAAVTGGPVLLPEAYRDKVGARPELARLAGAIRWMPDERAALAAASGVVIATPPARQLATARAAMLLPNIERIVLEKPLAPDPASAAALVEDLERHGKRFRVGYTFLHATWAQDLAWPRRGEAERVAITWTFMAHHYARGLANWKREHAAGGGALRFFGIHLFAVLARAGYLEVPRCSLDGLERGEVERWSATFTGPELPECQVHVDSRAGESAFRIEGRVPLVTLADPYGAEDVATEHDRRVGVLERFLCSFDAPDAEHARFCRAVNELWRRAEVAAR